MNKKKLLSILGSACLAFAMIFSAGLEVSALTEQDTGEVTLTGFDKTKNEEAAIDIYKIGDVNLDRDVVALKSLSWSKEVRDWVTNHYPTYIEENEYISDTFQKLNSNITGKEANIFYQDMEKDILGGNLKLTALKHEMTTGDDVVLNLPMGVYLASIKADDTIYQTVSFTVFPVLEGDVYTIPSKSVNIKKADTSIDKEIVSDDFSKPSEENAKVAVGDDVPFKVSATIPKYQDNTVEASVQFMISDTMQKGLKYNEDLKVYGNKELTDELKSSTDYTLEESSEKGFTIKLKWSYLQKHQGESIYLAYTAEVTKDAVVSGTSENDVKLVYSNKNTVSEKHDTETVRTYNISFDKKDATNANLLKNAEFEILKNGNPLGVVEESDGVYVVSPDSQATTLTSTSGKFVIKGLDATDYVLKETKAPTGGYVLPQNASVDITLLDDNFDGYLDDTSAVQGNGIDTEKTETQSGVSFSFIVKNKKAGDLDLPVTGGTGTLIYTLGGLAVMGGAVYLFVSNKKKDAK